MSEEIKFNEVEYYKKAIGKVTCAYKENIIIVDGKARVNAKRTQEREKYLFQGLKEDGSDNIVLIDSLDDELNIEFELKSSKGEETTKEKIEEWIGIMEQRTKELKLDYCVFDHGGTSPYFKLCNLNGLIEGKEKECKKILAELIVPREALSFVDLSNLGKTLVPVMNRPHWKPKYNGTIHKITRGKDPNQHNNNVGDLIISKLNLDSRIFTIKEGRFDEDIKIVDIWDISKLKKHGEEYYGSHFIHGSEGGSNFWVNPKKNSWFCFRHGVGGGPATAILVKEGLLNCEDVKKGVIKGELKIKLESLIRNKYNTKEKLKSQKFADFTLIWEPQLKEYAEEERSWIVERYLPTKSIGILTGKRGTFKTYLALYIAYSVASGKVFMGNHQVRKGGVLYLDKENGLDLMKKRGREIKRGLELGDEDLNIGFICFSQLRIDREEDLAKIENLIREHKPILLIIDTYRRAIGFEENDAGQVSKLFVESLRPLADKYDVTILLVHHDRKSTGQGDEMAEIRGSSDLANYADFIIKTDRERSGILLLKHLKSRGSKEEEPLKIRVEIDDEKRIASFVNEGEYTKQTMDEKCAEFLLVWISKNNLETFETKEAKDAAIKEGYKPTNFKKSLNILIQRGSISTNFRGVYDVTKDKEEKLD